MDFKSSFLNCFIIEDVYVKQPQGFEYFHFMIMFSNSKRLYMIKNKYQELGMID
jgi:hypothetical protein